METEQTAPSGGVHDSDLEKRRIALEAAIAMHGPGALSVDVLETASDFYTWLGMPARRIISGASPAVALRQSKERKTS